MTDKLSAVPALKAGVDFDWWAMTFQSHLLLNKELLVEGKQLLAEQWLLLLVEQLLLLLVEQLLAE